VKLRKATVVCLLALGAGEILGAGTAQATDLNATDIESLLVGRYACGTGDDGETWDETLASTGPFTGTVTDYKKGPGDAIDPSTQVGTYTINANNNTITYNYGSGGSFTYTVSNGTGTNAGPGTYTFTGPQILTITVSATHCL